MSRRSGPGKVRERDDARARTFAHGRRRVPAARGGVDPDRIQVGYRALYAAMGLGGIAAQFLITANMLMRGAMVLGTSALLFMAVTGRVPGWWEK